MSIIDQAKIELAAVKFGEEDSRVMIEILEKFFDQWDSGGAVHAVAPVLQRLIAGKPLGPLTGADDEWFQPMDGMEVWQNRRCGSVFKERSALGDLVCFDIDARPPPDADPVFLADRKRVRYPIAFPYRHSMITNLDMASDDPDVAAMNCSFTATEMFVRQQQGEEWHTFVLTRSMAEQLQAGLKQFLALDK